MRSEPSVQAIEEVPGLVTESHASWVDAREAVVAGCSPLEFTPGFVLPLYAEFRLRNVVYADGVLCPIDASWICRRASRNSVRTPGSASDRSRRTDVFVPRVGRADRKKCRSKTMVHSTDSVNGNSATPDQRSL